MATHRSMLAWRIPCPEEPGGCSPQATKSQTDRAPERSTAHRASKCESPHVVSNPSLDFAVHPPQRL